MVKTTRKRKSPQPVKGTCRWCGGAPSQARLDEGDAILSISPDGKETSFYFVTANKDGAKVVGYRLVKIDALDKTTTYDVNADTWECDCPDATHTDRPGGCKHSKALRAALALCSK
jgi:hypothetical protein